MDEQQLVVPDRKTVVHHHVHPLTKLPELQTEREEEESTDTVNFSIFQYYSTVLSMYLEMKDPSVLSICEALSMWNNPSQNFFI